MDITVDHIGEHAVVRVSGRIVRDNQRELRVVLEEAVANEVQGIALDFRNVEYLDSSGMGLCVSALKHLHDRNSGSIVVFGASADIERVWKLIRLDLVVPLVADEEAALVRLRKPGIAT